MPVTVKIPTQLRAATDGEASADVDGATVLGCAPQLAASTGSACHSGLDTPSPVLTAMGLSRRRALGAVRLSLGRWTTEAEIERAATYLVEATVTAREYASV